MPDIDKTLYNTLLFDFYGDLLTKKQRDAFDRHFLQDWSMQELAGEYGFSRQAAQDFVSKAAKSLQNYEDKLGFIAVYQRNQDLMSQLAANLERLVYGKAMSSAIKAEVDSIIDRLRKWE